MKEDVLKRAGDFVRSKIGAKPEIFILLREGLSEWAERLDDKEFIDWCDVPGAVLPIFPKRSLSLISGIFKSLNILCLNGRLHYYEGISMSDVLFPVKIASLLGVKVFIFTCSAGLVSDKGQVGSLMIVSDYINLMGVDPLHGEFSLERKKMYPIVANAYDEKLCNLALRLADEFDIPTFKGVYVARSGPTYETKAEVKFLRLIGGDAVGMSLVPETVWAVREGGRVLGLCMITNRAGAQFEGDEAVLNITTSLANGVFSIIDGVLSYISGEGLS